MAEWRPSQTQEERLTYRRRQAVRRGAIAVVSTIVALVALAVLTVRSPGWAGCRRRTST